MSSGVSATTRTGGPKTTKAGRYNLMVRFDLLLSKVLKQACEMKNNVGLLLTDSGDKAEYRAP